MTNLEKWKLICRNFVSPESYIHFSFYFTIAASLQRRVWLGDLNFKPIFPNLYLILIGPSGVGKGLVITEAGKLLRFHEIKHGSGSEDVKYLFATGADTTGFEKLIVSMSRAIRACKLPDGKLYTHSSIYFALEELDSLFRKHHEQVVRFLNQTYDAGDYSYETIKREEDRVKNCCTSLIAGTTPEFVEETLNGKLMAAGMTARCLFCYEPKNRFERWEIPPLDEEQTAALDALRAHILRLSVLVGSVRFNAESNEFLRVWWEETQHRKNQAPRLAPYYAKKNMLVKKLCMAYHFAECTDLEAEINIDTAKAVLRDLSWIEDSMHNALSFAGKNTLGGPCKLIQRYLEGRNGTSHRELLMRFYDDIPDGDEGLTKIMGDLDNLGYVKTERSGNGEIVYHGVKK